MKVALVHYWWLSNRGGEAVVAALSAMYPEADIYLHVGDEQLMRQALGSGFKGRIFKSFISRLPGAMRNYQKYLMLMPLASEQLNLTSYDLVISSESGPAKGVITRPDALHLCYCHSPMRYVWDMYHEYSATAGRLIRVMFPLVAHYLRMWDRLSADRVDHFIANSTFVASRIRKFYRREADVIYPPVNVRAFSHTLARSDFYLLLGQLVHYKRADLAVDAFNDSGLPLVIIGEGEQFNALKARARPNIRLLGRQPFEQVRDHLQRCKALIFPGVEDFGIVPVEAMAAGAPVIAFARGGALETVKDGVTGLLFTTQDAASLASAVERLQSGALRFDPEVLRAHALEFDVDRFQVHMRTQIEKFLPTGRTDWPPAQTGA